MSTTLMGLGVKAMTASYAALQTTGHNIANASVAGFSRQEVNLQTAEGMMTRRGFYGRGVEVGSITRAHDVFLTREATATKSVAAMDATRLQHLQELENVFKPGEMGLGHASSELMASLSDMSSRPADLATRQVVLARAGDLAGRFDEASSAMDDSQLRVTAELGAVVAQINGLLSGVAQANLRIALMQGAQQMPNDLLDERDRMISDMAQLVQVTRMEAEDGSVGLFTVDGQRLVLGTDAVKLKVLPHESDPQRASVGFNDYGISRKMNEATLGGGRLTGLLRYQNDDLMIGRNLVGRMAASLAGAINEQQIFGLNLQAPVGQVPSRPLFATGPTRTLGFETNARNASGVFVGSVALTITDPAALEATSYELREDPSAPGNWQLTRLMDGRVTNVADGDTVDGWRIDFGVPGPQPDDQFLLEPVTRAASGMQRLLNDPRDLAAALPLLATKGLTNMGTVGVASLQMTTTPVPVAGATARITFTDDIGNYNWDLLDAANAVLASGSGSWAPGQPVPTPPTDINGFSLLLEGVPRSGDTLRVAPTPAGAVATNNGNALLMMSLRDAAIVGGRSPTDAWALALSEIGVRTQGGKMSADISSAVATSAESNRSASAGVNLDEEAATLIQYQQSYQAAAKVLQVAQALFDALLQATGR